MEKSRREVCYARGDIFGQNGHALERARRSRGSVTAKTESELFFFIKTKIIYNFFF
jgi:hypothetical protein